VIRVRIRVLTHVCAALCLLWMLQGAAHAQPKVILVLANHLSLSDLKSGGYESGLMARLSQVREWKAGLQPQTLVSPGLPDKKDPVNASYARMADSTYRPEFTEDGLAATGLSAVTTTIIGTTAGDDTSDLAPITSFLKDPVNQINPEQHDARSPGGLVDNPDTFRNAVYAALKNSNLVVVQWGDLDRIEAERSSHLILPSVAEADRQKSLENLGRFVMSLPADKRAHTLGPVWLILVSPVPPIDSHGGWNSLTPCVITRIDAWIPPSDYTSDTTQTPGLIAQRDVAPTILDLLGRPADGDLTGAAAHTDNRGDLLSQGIDALDRQTRNNQIVESPFFWTMGFLLAFIGFGIVWTMRGQASHKALRLCSYGLRIIAVWPGAMLVAAILPATSPTVYFISIYALIFLLAFLPSVSTILIGTSAVLLIDCVTGSHLISASLFSAYALSGIRFYGIGNEYMGVLIAGTLLASQSICERMTGTNGTIKTKSWRLPVVFLFALVTVIMSCPAFGAKAGAALTCGITFAAAYSLLGTGKIRFWHVLLGLFAGVLMLCFWIGASSVLGLRHTHLQQAYTAVGVGKSQVLFTLILSKLELAFTVLTHPGTIVGGLALLVFGFTVHYVLLKPLEKQGKPVCPTAKLLYTACLAGSAACILLNDSGVVAAILLFSMTTVGLLYGMVVERCELQPSTLEKSESA